MGPTRTGRDAGSADNGRRARDRTMLFRQAQMAAYEFALRSPERGEVKYFQQNPAGQAAASRSGVDVPTFQGVCPPHIDLSALKQMLG